jgi:hypothetical protein
MRSCFFFKGPVAKLCPSDRAAKQGEKLKERAAAEAWIRRRLGILGGWAWWSTRASSGYEPKACPCKDGTYDAKKKSYPERA